MLIVALAGLPIDGKNVAANGSLLCCKMTFAICTIKLRVNSAMFGDKMPIGTHATDWFTSSTIDDATGT